MASSTSQTHCLNTPIRTAITFCWSRNAGNGECPEWMTRGPGSLGGWVELRHAQVPYLTADWSK